MADVNFTKVLRAGDRISFTENQVQYSSIIDEVTSDSTINIVQPVGIAFKFRIRPDAEYRVVCINDLGLHCFTAVCINADNESRVKTMELEYTGDYSRVQNRQFFRCQVSLPVEVRKRPRGSARFEEEEKPEVKPAPADWRSLIPLVADEDLPAPPPAQPAKTKADEGWIMSNTLDISTGGVKVRLSGMFEKNDVIQMNLHVNKFGFDNILPNISGVIVRAIPVGDGTRDVVCGVEFLGLDSKARNLLSRFIVACQRNSRAKEQR